MYSNRDSDGGKNKQEVCINKDYFVEKERTPLKINYSNYANTYFYPKGSSELALEDKQQGGLNGRNSVSSKDSSVVSSGSLRNSGACDSNQGKFIK